MLDRRTFLASSAAAALPAPIAAAAATAFRPEHFGARGDGKTNDTAAFAALGEAINRAGGSTDGAKLAAQMGKFRNAPTVSGKVSFSPALHSVFGRTYRVMVVQNNKPKYVGQIKASSPAKIS